MKSNLTAFPHSMPADARSPPIDKDASEPDTPATQRIYAARDFLRDHVSLLPTLVPGIGGSDAAFESAIRGSSMSPAIPGGAKLRVQLRSGHTYQRGDIVYYLSNNGYVVHRIIHVLRRGPAAGHMLTLGDNRLIPDPPIGKDQILGSVIAVQTTGAWHPPGPQTNRSIYHRLARTMASGTLIIALRFGVSAACRIAIILTWIESVTRRPVGHILRRLHLIPSGRNGEVINS